MPTLIHTNLVPCIASYKTLEEHKDICNVEMCTDGCTHLNRTISKDRLDQS